MEKQYDQEVYLAAVKKFQKESKGLMPNSPEWNAVRNRIYSELRDQKYKEMEDVRHQSGQTVLDAT